MGDLVSELRAQAREPRAERIRRRLLTLIAYPLAFGVLVALAAPLLLLATLRDLALRTRFATLRALVFIGVYLACELAGIVSAGAIALAAKLGARPDETMTRYYRLQWWWARTLFGALTRLYELEVSVRGREGVSTERPIVLLMRHTSMADTLLPGVLLSSHLQLRLRYVLKRELLWDPCLDLVGNQIPNVFVRRGSSQSQQEVERVGELASSMRPGDGVLVYPEGTRFTAARREKMIEQLERDGSSRLSVARSLRNVLPPRRGGTLALLDAAPEADVVVCTHRGFENVAGFGDLVNGGLVGQRVAVEFWPIARRDVPASAEGRTAWLDETWERVDSWVAEEASRETPERR